MSSGVQLRREVSCILLEIGLVGFVYAWAIDALLSLGRFSAKFFLANLGSVHVKTQLYSFRCCCRGDDALPRRWVRARPGGRHEQAHPLSLQATAGEE